MPFQIAFYRGKSSFIGRLVRWWDNGPYSHCEVIFSDGYWGTAMHGRGVVFRHLGMPSGENWDVIELPGYLEADARKWFESHNGKDYDYSGFFRFMFDFLNPSRDKWFCSRACADSLGIVDGWRVTPNGLYSQIRAMRLWYDKV